MATTSVRGATNARDRVHSGDLTDADPAWKPLHRIAGMAAVAVVALMAAGMVVFFVWPPPSTAGGYFSRFHENPLIGLLDQDLLLVVIEVLLIPVTIALYIALRRVSPSYSIIGVALGLIGITLMLASNTAFNMLTLSSQYAAASSDEQRTTFLAAGEASLAAYQGTAFVSGIVLTALADLLFAILMLRSAVFGRAAAYVGIGYAILAVVPANAGTPGMVLALLSILPLAIWLLLIARGFFRVSRLSTRGIT